MLEEFKGRKTRWHNQLVLEVERFEAELRETAELIATRLNRARGSTMVIIPKRGFHNEEGRPWEGPQDREIFLQTLKVHLSREVELDVHINDPPFAEEVVEGFD